MLQPQERLRLAVIEGNLPIAKRLLSRFPELWLNIDYQNNGWSNLHYASNGGNYLVCFHLISLYNHRQSECKDLQITPFDLLAFDQMLVIHLAAENHHIQTLHYLLQEFPGSFWLNSPGGCHGRTPLHLSCIKGFQEGIRLLVEYGADPTIKDNLGNTCLHYLFEYEHMECVWAIHQVILRNAKSKDEAEAFLNKLELIKNNKGSTALDYAPSVAFRKQYKKRKQHVLSQDLNGTILDLADLVSRKSALTLDETKSTSSKGTLTSTATNANCSLSNKFPVIEADVYPSLDDELFTKRAHSQSLPTDLPQPTKISEHPTTTRRRSNTTIAKASTGTPQTPTATCGVYPKPPPPPLKSITISPSIRNSSFSRENHSPPISPQSASTTSNPSNYASSSPSQFRRKYSNNSSFMATPLVENVTLTESRPFSVVLPQLPHNDLSSPGSTAPSLATYTPSRGEAVQSTMRQQNPQSQPETQLHHQSVPHAQHTLQSQSHSPPPLHPEGVNQPMFKQMIPIFPTNGHISYQPLKPIPMSTTGSFPSTMFSSTSTSQLMTPDKKKKSTSESPPSMASSNGETTKQRSERFTESNTSGNLARSSIQGSNSSARHSRRPSKVSTTSSQSSSPSSTSASVSATPLLASAYDESSDSQSVASRRSTINCISFSRVR